MAIKNFTKVNFLDAVNKPKFKRRELGNFAVMKRENYPTQEYLPQRAYAPRKGWKFLLYIFLVLLIVFVTFSSNVIFSSSSLLDNLTKLSPGGTFSGIWSQFKKLITPGDKLLSGEKEDRVNILLLGQGGAGHEGAYLTDTIMLLSIKLSTNQVATLSIPRDLYAPIAGDSWRKINYANAYGEVEKNGKGGEIASETVSNVFALPIHYYIRIDFKGFQKAIDDLGGVTIYVDRSFTDSLFPTANFGVETISFKEGWQKMDGETALKYVRSRHGDNGEGSDFARSQRQQKLILAFKDKIFSLSSLLQPQKILKALGDFNEHLKTNLENWEIIRLAKLARNIDFNTIKTRVLDNSESGPLVAAITEDGSYVLKPKSGNFNDLANIAENIFIESAIATSDYQTINKYAQGTETAISTAENISEESKTETTSDEPGEKTEFENTVEQSTSSTSTTATSTPLEEPKFEKTKLVILNGTKKTGLAQKTAKKLAGLDYEIVSFGNALDFNYQETIIYDLTNGVEPQDLQFLIGMFDGETANSLPESLEEKVSESDFLIILGQDYVNSEATQ